MSSNAEQGEQPTATSNGYSALKPSNGNQEDATQPLNGRTTSQDDDIEWQVDQKDFEEEFEEEEYDVEHDEEMIEIENLAMPEDMYGFALTSLFRDLRMISLERGEPCLRRGRLIASQVFILLCIFTQAFLLMQTKLLVTSMHVHEIRELYDKFEWHMYGEKEEHTWLTVNGKHRGYHKFFKPENFDTLDDDIKGNICLISLSRPYFFMIILTIWSLTCLGEAKACCDQAWSIFCTPAVSNMKYSLLGLTKYAGPTALKLKDRLPQALQERVENLSPNERLVVGMTKAVKTYVLTCIMLPRLLITLFLLWLGCRWLLATSGFENVLLNAVALEFILVLKDLLYNTVLPERNKREVQNTSMLPFNDLDAHPDVKEKASCSKYFGSFALFGLAVIWVYLYTYYLQQVIPGFNWDVSGVCRKYVEKISA